MRMRLRRGTYGYMDTTQNDCLSESVIKRAKYTLGRASTVQPRVHNICDGVR